LGATNPSQFDIEFFVNDLSVNVASTFEPLGKFSYNQNECINLECRNNDIRKIPTDGLVLKGCYTTITLAVYGNIITYGSMPKIAGQGNNVDNSAAQISSNEETNESDNGEIYNNNMRKHHDFQDQNSSCDPTVSSTIADDLKEEEPNTSPVDIYSRSPSKEQDLQKPKREWSNSPESYQNNKRARVSSYDYERRKPRTPPLQSPRISRPDSDDDISKKNRSIDNEYGGDLSTTYCPSSPSMINNNTPIESPTEMDEEPVELEPIESDEDIIDDVNGIEELTEELFSEEFAIKIFNPFFDDLKAAEKLPVDTVKRERFLEQMTKYCENYEKLFGDEAISNENWLSMCEQILHCLHSSIDQIETINERFFKTLLACIKIGLNYSLSIKYHQPGHNLRHLKVGIRLVECFANNEDFIKWIYSQAFDLFQNLFELFAEKLIPVPVKLLTARVIYKLLDTKEGVERFTSFDGYKNIVNMLDSINDIRLLYTLKTTLKKIHIYESLEKIRELTSDIYKSEASFEQLNEMEILFASLIESHKKDVLQTRKFVPITSQFEVLSKVKSPAFVSFYKIHNLLETIILLINVKHSLSPKLLLNILNYLQLMMSNGKEFAYLTSDMEMLNEIVKLLLDTSEGEVTVQSDNIEVGLEIAYKTSAKFILDSISHLSDDLEIAEYLNSLYYLCVGAGRKHVLEYIAMEDNLCVFLNLIDKEKKLGKAQGSPGFKHKSPVLSYSVDIVDFVVRNVDNLGYLKKYESVLLNLVKHHDSFEPSVAAMLQEMSIFLKPLEIEKIFNYDDLTPLIETIKRSMEFLTNFPGDLVMTLRILRYMIVRDEWNPTYRELKNDFYVALLYNTTEGAVTLLSILEKLSTHFDQPMVHSYLFGANQGEMLMKTIHPIIQILRKIFVQIIESRNVNFKDITAIEILLKTFTLLDSINTRCSTYKEAKEIQKEIIQILLAYTQSMTPDGMTTTNIHKSLWTQMIGEIIKYTLSEPCRFTSGLSILSEMLPLPLPVPIQGNELNKIEMQKFITERQLWSAHLHPQSQIIMELIQSFCTTSSTELFIMIYKVCVQLSDLAPNMTLLVARSVVELVLAEAADKNNEGSATLSRLLKFLALLSRHACVKVSILSILSGKLAEVMSQLLKITNDTNIDHVTSQFYVFSILQNLFDCEISLLFNSDHSPELILASGLPFKEFIVQFSEDVVDNFVKNSAENLNFAALRTMVLLSEHDVTLKALKNSLLSRDEKVVERFNSIAEKCKNDRKHIQIIPDVLLLLRSLITIEPSETSNIPPRTITLTISELAKILKWNSEEYSNGNCVHFLQIFNALVNEVKEDESFEIIENAESLKADLSSLISQLQDSKVNSVNSSDEDFSLPQAEGIVTQFSSRVPFYVADLEDITIDYWMLNTCDDFEQQSDPVQYDLNELVKEFLPPDTNIASDCKRLFSLSSSPQATKDKSQTGLCFRTRRVEVNDPIPGRPEKKVFGKCKIYFLKIYFKNS
jgi:hypothetical protein